MADSFLITNTLPVDEPAYGTGYNLPGGLGVEDGVNPGAKTGPYGNGLRDNTIAIPLPLTNFQIKLGAGESVEIAVDGVLETEFIKALVDTLPVTVTPADAGGTDGGEG